MLTNATTDKAYQLQNNNKLPRRTTTITEHKERHTGLKYNQTVALRYTSDHSAVNQLKQTKTTNVHAIT